MLKKYLKILVEIKLKIFNLIFDFCKNYRKDIRDLYLFKETYIFRISIHFLQTFKQEKDN